ncbi:MAG: hypothetical protein ABEH77_01470 [Halobacteriaceae archaeon]
MSEEDRGQDRADTGEEFLFDDAADGFVFDDADDATADRAMDAVLEAGRGETRTTPREEVEAAILDDAVEYFQAEYDPTELGVPAPDAESVRGHWFDFDYLEDCAVVSWRWSMRPYSYTAIVYDPEENEHRYRAETPALSEFEQYVREDLTRSLRQDLMHRDIGPDERRRDVFEAEIGRLLDEHAAAVPPATLLRVVYYLRRDFVRYGKIDPLMQDPAIEDISCDGIGVPLFVYHRD